MGFVERQYDSYVWEYKYRPKTINEIILPQRFKNQFNKMVEQKLVPNMLLSGTRGCGKTTVAFCLIDQIGCEARYINMAKDNSIDMIRHDLSRFAGSVSVMDDCKRILFGDEFDRLSIEAIDALKSDMDYYGKNCSFIFTSNNKYRFFDHPVISRLQEIDFEFTKEEKIDMQKQLLKAVKVILEKEGIKYEVKAVGKMIQNLFPDMRKILNELQKLSQQTNGNITINDAERTLSLSDINLFFDALKAKDFGFVREYISNISIDKMQFFGLLNKHIEKYIAPGSFPTSIVLLDEYQFHAAMSIDKEIPITALTVRLMNECEWK